MRAVLVALTLAGLGVAAATRADDAYGPAATAPTAHSFKLGRLQLVALRDAMYVLKNDGQTFGVDAGAAAVGELLKANALPTDRITLNVDALLVRTGTRVVLLDTGLGPKLHGALLASLRSAGVAPDAVTDVVITHTHGDHVGGLVDAGGALAFPNATIRMAAAEWAWMKGQAGSPELVKAIEPRVQTFTPGKPVAPGITPIALDGHTPGHVGYEIVSGKARLLDIGDLAHSSVVSLQKPEWTVAFDKDAAVAKATRKATLARLAKSHELVFAPHFPFPGVGHVVAAGGAYRWKPATP